MTAASLVGAATAAALTLMPSVASAGRLAEGVTRKNGVVAIGPCDPITARDSYDAWEQNIEIR